MNGESCPIPESRYPEIVSAHGAGGRLMHQLIRDCFLSPHDRLRALHDGAVLEMEPGRMAFTTDSYTVSPLFFPGGDIGRLAVFGTVNDLAMCGARPRYLSCGVILEEGFPVAELERIASSMRTAASSVGVRIVTGDTKVVGRGKGDGIFINTAGLGWVPQGIDVSPGRIAEGDLLLLNGDIGRHGIAIMTAREGLEFEHGVTSDLADLSGSVSALTSAGVDIHCLRDLTRGGLASGLVELSESSGLGFRVSGKSIPVHPGVESACEILGLDPMHVANEGRFLLIVPEHAAGIAERILNDAGESAVVIGRVVGADPGGVVLETEFGTERFVQMLSGDPLPRIC
jgi:hydrogenase expression/formation protein HypE